MVCPVQHEATAGGEQVAHTLWIVSPQRLIELGPRLLDTGTVSGTGAAMHRLLRFNLYNFGKEPVSVYAVALKNAGGDRVSCQVDPPVVLQAGARYPFMFEVTSQARSEEVDIQVEHRAGHFVWVLARTLPRE